MLCAYPDFSAHNSPWPPLCHRHFTDASAVLCKAGLEADLCSFGPPDPPARSGMVSRATHVPSARSLLLLTRTPLQPSAGRGMEPTSPVSDPQHPCVPRGEQRGLATQLTGQRVAGSTNLPLRQDPFPVHRRWLESPRREPCSPASGTAETVGLPGFHSASGLELMKRETQTLPTGPARDTRPPCRPPWHSS